MTNVLLITTDQQRADTAGAAGNPVIQTPHLDRLASQGTRYAECRTQNPYCQPSRATILTGRYPSRHGVTSNGIDLPLDAEAHSLATAFANAGHATAIFGKAHFASTYPMLPTGKIESVEGSASVDPEWHGPYFGFQHCELVLFGHMIRFAPLMGQWNWAFGPPPFGLHYARHLFRDGHAAGLERLRLMQPEADGGTWDHTQTWRSLVPEEEHPTAWTADRAIAWIDRQDGPFFAWVSFADPHHPMDAPAPWCDRYAPSDVGQVLWREHAGDLDGKPPIHAAWAQGARGRPQEWANPGGATLTRDELARMVAGYYGMVSMVDHHVGRVLNALEASGKSEDTLVIFTSDHGDFMGDHQMMFKGPIHYDGLLKVPMIVRGPGVSAGAVNREPVGTIDIAPTALRAAGVDAPQWMQGRDLSQPREWCLTENDHQMMMSISLRTLTTRRYKLTIYLDRPDMGELYDLHDDPLELENRWEDRKLSEVRSDMLAELASQMSHDVRREPMVGVVG